MNYFDSSLVNVSAWEYGSFVCMIHVRTKPNIHNGTTCKHDYKTIHLITDHSCYALLQVYDSIISSRKRSVIIDFPKVCCIGKYMITQNSVIPIAFFPGGKLEMSSKKIYT